MLGRAGAAQVWKRQQKEERGLGTNSSLKSEGRQNFVFEGVRASKGDRGTMRGRNKTKGNTKSDGRGRRRLRTRAWKARSKT